MLKKLYLILCLIAPVVASAQSREAIRFGDFENWVTRNVHESGIIGGADRTVYAIGPTRTVKGASYTPDAKTPWATSNVVAKVAGVTKCSNAVFPDTHPGHGKCAKLTSMIEHCKAAGLINVDVMVAGTLFLGRMIEPIKSTKNPYSKMEMGMPYTHRPKALVFDYRVEMPAKAERIYSSGFGSKRTMKGSDRAEAFVFLQYRWEDADGNIYARRVGTARELYGKSTAGWVNGHKMEIHYGDITRQPYYTANMGLIPKNKSYYARNSKGKMVPVQEVGWASANEAPTHAIVMFSAGSGEPYTGTPGLTLWVDNVAFEN